MVEYMTENRIDLSPALATRDPQEIGKALMSVKTQMSLAELNRQVKNQAQTLTGTNSSTEAVSYWDRVKQASGLPSFRI
jgi:hypothetical protein